MKILLYTTALLLLVASVKNSAEAKEWRGLTPLHSTRADVIRLLNQCSNQREACRFSLEGESVYILFAAGLTSDYAECAERLGLETIMFIQVEPRKSLKFSELHLKKKDYASFSPTDPTQRGYQGFRTPDGFLVRAYKGRILQLSYIANESDRQRCSKYYESPESFVEIILNHYSNMYVDGPESVKAGENLMLSAHSNINDKAGYTWTVNAGKIMSGQFTTQIVIDTQGLLEFEFKNASGGNDSWHSTINEAEDEAKVRFGIEPSEWKSPSNPDI